MDEAILKKAKKLRIPLKKSVSDKLSNYVSANTWIDEINQFKKLHNLDDASVDVTTEQVGYYNEVDVVIKIHSYVDKSEAELISDIDRQEKYKEDVRQAELKTLEKLQKKYKKV